MKASQYGGSDTHKTQGMQPAPHEPEPKEQLRLMYATDPSDVTSEPGDARSPFSGGDRGR